MADQISDVSSSTLEGKVLDWSTGDISHSCVMPDSATGIGDEAVEGDLSRKLYDLVANSQPPPPSFEEELSSTVEGDYIEIGPSIGSEQSYFDTVIGAIEDIVMDDDFHNVQTMYLDRYWPEFSEDQTENLHTHFEMFKEYSQAISSFMEDKLKSVLENFDMEIFVEQLGSRGDLDGDIFEMLFTLIDFVKFRELLLDYRAMMEGKTLDLSNGISVRSIQPSQHSKI